LTASFIMESADDLLLASPHFARNDERFQAAKGAMSKKLQDLLEQIPQDFRYIAKIMRSLLYS